MEARVFKVRVRFKFFQIQSILLILASLCTEVYAARAVPDDNLSYPVLITLKSGAQGSGFFLNIQDKTFLVTARHVLFKENSEDLLAAEAEILSYGKDPKDTGKNVVHLNLGALKHAGKIKGHTSHDVAVVHIGSDAVGSNGRITLLEPGVVKKEGALSGIIGVGGSSLKRFGEVLTANQVFIFGYPGSIGLRNIPQIDYLKPLLRAGIVAGTNEKTRTIIIDCPAYQGNSGGAVLEVEHRGLEKHFKVIGVVSQFVPFVETWQNITHRYTNINLSNSGYAVAIPMDFVLELISQY